MSAPPDDHSPGSPTAGGPWRVAQLSAAFVVDIANLSRPRRGQGDQTTPGDVLEPLVFAAIVQANQALLAGDPAVRARYGDTGETLPDELRRPISISAVAESLRIPYETARRRVQGMVQAGLCVLTPAGAVIPQAVIASEAHAALQRARLARLLAFHDDLREAGFFAAHEILERAPDPSLTRPANRALSQYMLRTCERVVELSGGAVDGFVLLGLAAANGESLARSGVAEPVSALALSGRLGLPDETARRRLRALAERGLARRRKKGWLVSARPTDLPLILRHVEEHAADLKRLFSRLRELAAIEVAPN
jgi:predicted ArsR family transcriptional regulator